MDSDRVPLVEEPNPPVAEEDEDEGEEEEETVDEEVEEEETAESSSHEADAPYNNRMIPDAERPLDRPERWFRRVTQGYPCQRHCHFCLIVCGRLNRGPVLTHDCRITFTPTSYDIPLCWVCFDLLIRTQAAGLRRADP
mgnify:CR=1 FL=1